MNTFHFYLDEKRIVWHRLKFSVDADKLEDAQEIAKKMVENNEDIDFYDADFLYETEENMTIEDNKYQPTQELFCNETKETLYDNLITHKSKTN